MALIDGYEVADPLGYALWWQTPETSAPYLNNDGTWARNADGSLALTGTRPALPELLPTATPDDRRIYDLIQQAYNTGVNPDAQRLVQEAQYNPGTEHTDPNIINFLAAQNYNANLTDAFSPWGDQFFTALLGFGLATGGAAAFGGFAPVAGGAGAGVTAGSAAGLEGEGALFASTLGPAGAGTGTLAAPLPLTTGGTFLGATGEAGAAGGVDSAGNLFAGPLVEGAGGAAGPAVSVGELGGIGAAGGAGAGAFATPTAGASLTPAAGTLAPASEGILGTGLTAGQLVRLAPLIATAGTALAGALDGGGSGSDTEGGTEANEALFERLRQLAAGSIPERLPGIIQTQRELTERANASPQDLMSDLRSQIQGLRGELQKRFQAAGSAMGPSGGRQAEKAQSQVLAGAGRQLNDWVKQATAPAGANLTNFLSGVRPSLVTALPQPVSTVGPTDFSPLVPALRGAGQIYRSNWFDSTPDATYDPYGKDPVVNRNLAPYF